MNEKELQELYKRYAFIIYGRCIRILKSHEEAQDAMQVVFLKLIEAHQSIRDREKIVPWIFTAAKNHCFNQLRSTKRFSDEACSDDIESHDKFDERYGNRQLLSMIMMNHSESVRDAVYYTHIEELSQEEIRKITGQSPATVRRNLKKFKDSIPGLRKRLGL